MSLTYTYIYLNCFCCFVCLDLQDDVKFKIKINFLWFNKKAINEQIPEDELHLLLSEIDTNKNGLIELDEVTINYVLFMIFMSQSSLFGSSKTSLNRIWTH